MSVTTVNLGKIRLNWRGNWATSTAYSINDAVYYGGSSYVCVTANTSGTWSSDLASSFWQIMASGATANTTAGDITYYGASGNTNLNIGSYGQVLTVGSSGYPIWQSPVIEGDVFYVSINGNDSNNGTSLNQAWKTLKYACTQVTGPATIYIKTGTYYETLPITVPANVSIIGDSMRDTTIAPLTGTASATYTSGGSATTTLVVSSTSGILAGMTVTGTGYTGGQKVVSVTNGTTLVMSAVSNAAPSGTLTFTYLSTDASPVVNNLSTMFYLSDQTMLQGLLLTGMTGFTFNGSYPTDVSRATIGGVYLRLNPSSVITKSPYVKDCTAKSTGGVGAIVDGSVQAGGNKSMVFWAYNMVLDGGVGIWASNGGKAEAVSVFTYYAYIGYTTTGGGLIRSIAGNNSYGTYGVVSSGYLSTETPVTGTVYGGMLTFNIALATGTFVQGETVTQATSGATGVVTSVQTGYLYVKSTVGTFNTTNLVTGGTSAATMTPTVVGGQSNYVLVLSTVSGTITAGASIQFVSGDTSAYVVSAVSTATVSGTALTILTLSQQKTTASADGVGVQVRYNFSLIRLQSHDFLQIGTGGVATTNYPGTPTQGPTPANQISYTFPGRVYYVSTDELGNFYVGQYFSVNQATGSATLNASAFNLSGLTSLRLGSIGAQLGAQINEFSTDGTLSQNSDVKVPTQHAVTTYLGAAYQNISPAYDTVVTTATASSGTNITVGTTTGMVVGMTAVFGSNLGSLTAQTVYYILSASGTTITVGLAAGGSAITVGTTTGQSVAVNTGYSLGIASKRWSHLYVGPGSITVGSLTISDNGGSLQVQSSGVNAPANINAITNGTSNVTVANNGAVTITGGGNLGLTIASDGSATFAGSVTVNGGATLLSTTNLNIADALIYMATGNSGNINDIGIVGHFTSGIYQHTGMVRQASTNTWMFFSGATTEPGTTITTTDGTFVYDPVKMGALTASGNLTVTSATPTLALNNTAPTISTNSSGSTASVFNTNATTVNAFGAATTIGIGASTGTTTINNATVTLANATTLNVNGTNPTIATSSTGTLTLFNTNAATVNAFGAATTIAIGAASGTITLGNATLTGTNLATFNMNGSNPSIVTSSTGTVSVFNTNVLTGNLFGAATTINIGANATSSLNINNGQVYKDQNGFLSIGTTNTNLIGGNTNAKNLTVSGDGTVNSADGRLIFSNPQAYANITAGTSTAGRIYFGFPNVSGGTTTTFASIDALSTGSGGTSGYGINIRIQPKADNGSTLVAATFTSTGNMNLYGAAYENNSAIAGNRLTSAGRSYAMSLLFS